jgi:PTS system nitrogen regulatory IIA component
MALGREACPLDLSSIIRPEGVIAGLKTATKKQALQELAARAAEITGVHERTIFDILLERERLGTTGVGQGIAIPHGKLAEIDRLFGLFARLDQPIDFESIDEQPVDLIFLLLAPQGAGADHLKALAKVSRLLRDRETCEKLRHGDSVEAIYSLLTEPSQPHAA